MDKRNILLLFLTLCGFTLITAQCPYKKYEGYNYKLILCSIEINTPVDCVYNYLGNSSNAHYWSAVVDHITPLNPDSFSDGMPGSRRRCFTNENETGKIWDEYIVLTEHNKRRQLTIYNPKKFKLWVDNLATEQRYETISANKTRLYFSLFFLYHEPTFSERIKMRLSARKINRVFKKNLQRIKQKVEEKYNGK